MDQNDKASNGSSSGKRSLRSVRRLSASSSQVSESLTGPSSPTMGPNSIFLCDPKDFPDTVEGCTAYEEVLRLPKDLVAWAKAGMTACDIGRRLNEQMYGKDACLGNVVTSMVDAKRPYHDIGYAVLRNLDLYDASGQLLHKTVSAGMTSLVAEPVKAPEGAAQDPSPVGTELVCPKPVRAPRFTEHFDITMSKEVASKF